MMTVLTTRFCIVLALVTQGAAVKATPIEKVITLLKNLSEKLAAEGQREAAQYDKYACFCKEQADEKVYAMEKSDEKIKYLTAEIEELGTAKSALEDDIAELDSHIKDLVDTIADKTKKSDERHNEYLDTAKDMNEAISSCEGAIESLKNSKRQMKGAKLDLTQVTSGLVEVVKRQPLLTSAPGAVSLLSKIDQKGAPKFQYHSNDILATLQDLLATFKATKKDADIDEFNDNSAFEHSKLALLSDKKFSEKMKADKAAIAEAKAEAIGEASERKEQESSDYEQDKAFRSRLYDECKEKALLFDQRSQLRSKELSTLAEATTELEKGAAPNYKANKKIVGLQLSKVGNARNTLSSPVSLVQINNVQHQESRDEAHLRHVQSFLTGVADRSGSSALSAIASRVFLAVTRQGGDVDHFVKVRALIKDLLSKLQSDALSEANQKEGCDKGIEKATSDRDEARGRIEKANGKLTVLNSGKNALEEDNQQLHDQIEELYKARKEAGDLWKESDDNLDEQISMCKDGEASVQFALALLEKFYSKSALLQESPNEFTTDRDGNTVGDLAPDVFDSTYHGAQAESTGIIGILEVILADFGRTLRQAKDDKAEGKTMNKDFEDESKEDIRKKKAQINDSNNMKLADIKSDIGTQEQEVQDAQDLLDGALKSLESWHAMCVKGEETWEERAQKREQEVDALKEALEMLESWQQ